MTKPQHDNVTQLLARAQQGDRRATDELFPLVYDQLRALSQQHLANERTGHTLQATALVNEAYLRLVGDRDVTWESRAHFFGAAAKAIRRILTDHARSRGRIKRGGGAAVTPLPDDGIPISADDEHDFVAVDRALERLAAFDEQKARVVELRFFAGLTAEQTAAALGVSASTVARDWHFARVWLHREVQKEQAKERGEEPPP